MSARAPDMANGEWDGKVVMITGAARGLGRFYAERFLGLAAQVVAVDAAPSEEFEPLSDAARDMGVEDALRSSSTDVTNAHAIAALVEDVVSTWGRVDVLVNNAALYASLTKAPLEQISEQEWDQVMAVNVKGVWNTVRAVVPSMRGQGSGKIVNVSSSVVFSGTPRMLHYVASKGAVWAMTHAIARELQGTGITVNTVAPGLVENEASQRMLGGAGATADQTFAARVSERAVRRSLLADDLWGAVHFLASPASDMISGQTLTVDGGTHFS